MKAIKFLVAAVAMAFAMSANAKIFENNHFTVDASVGATVASSSYVVETPWGLQTYSGTDSQAAFSLGAMFQTEVFSTNWITLDWDVFRFAWVAPFNSPGDWDQLHFKTGVRAYSPSFAGDHLRAYTNLDMGYVLGLAKVPSWELDDDWEVDFDDDIETSSAFGLDWGLGIQLNKKFSFGYTLQFESNGKSKNHFFTFGFTF